MVDDWMVMSFRFTDKIEQTVMSVAKLYGVKPSGRFVKFYYPQTCLYGHEIGAFTVMTGLPDQQILFQLHRVVKAQTVVICPSLENAPALQQNNDMEEIAFTAYPAFKQWLNSYCNVGTPGQPVDVLVIDTFLEFAKGKINDVQLMLRKLVCDYPNMAIILIHHLRYIRRHQSHNASRSHIEAVSDQRAAGSHRQQKTDLVRSILIKRGKIQRQ